jgi:hypothetical protein
MKHQYRVIQTDIIDQCSNWQIGWYREKYHPVSEHSKDIVMVWWLLDVPIIIGNYRMCDEIRLEWSSSCINGERESLREQYSFIHVWAWIRCCDDHRVDWLPQRCQLHIVDIDSWFLYIYIYIYILKRVDWFDLYCYLIAAQRTSLL